MMNKKTKIIIVMCILVLFMAIGYSVLSTKLNIKGTSNITDSWAVKIKSVTSSATGRAYNITDPTYNDTTMTFNVGVKEPGDQMTFVVTVTNQGTLDAILDSIDASASGSYVIKYTINGLQEGTKLTAGASKTFIITTEFDINATEIPNSPIKELTIKLNYIQDDGQTLTPSNPIIEGEENTLANTILLNNQIKDGNNIDFSKTSPVVSSYTENKSSSTSSVSMSSSSKYYYSDKYSFDSSTGYYTLSGAKVSDTWANMSEKYKTYPYTCRSPSSTGTCVNLYKMTEYVSTTSGSAYRYNRILNYYDDSGLYYTNQNTENNKTTYFFRGNITNNYVSFAGLTWRIIRINEDGSVRLITQNSVGNSKINNSANDNAYVGYMYGTAGSSTYAATHANTNNSTIKTYLETWFRNNLNIYSRYISLDVGFCNDRSIASTANSWYLNDTALGYGTNETYYGAYHRLKNVNKPQFTCPQSNDLFTTSYWDSNVTGNTTLNYPIGLITADEVVYAGLKGSFLGNGYNFWTMSPCKSYSWFFVSNNTLNFASVSTSAGTRPVINLKSNVEISGGAGTSSDPYVIKTS